MKPLYKNLLFFVLPISVLVISCKKDSNTQQQTPPATVSGPAGIDGTVSALTTYNGNLIAGGLFSNADGISANNIAQWNGTVWSPLGSGMNGNVTVLIVYNGNLIAGGQFTMAGGNSANYIAQWNGSSWQSMGAGINGTVNALAVYNGKLIIGGEFTIAGGNPAHCIASWNGSKWDSLSDGVRGMYTNPVGVSALTVFRNKLIVGGIFSIAGSDTLANIAQWNDTNWSALGMGLNSNVFALTVFNGNLFAGGAFGASGSVNCDLFAQWNGTTWSSLGSYTYNGIPVPCMSSFTQYGGELIGVGHFYGGSTYFLAQWNGSTMSDSLNLSIDGDLGPRGSSSAAYLNAVTTYKGGLVIGGCFNIINGIYTNDIAQWNGSTWSAL